MVKSTNTANPMIFLAVLVFIIGFAATILQVSVSRNLPCANTRSCKESLEPSINNGESAVFDGETIDVPTIELTQKAEIKDVLGTESEMPALPATGEKHIYVDLSKQTLKAYQGDQLYLETKVSTGKWFPTPTGDFKIWRKIRATKMSGGEGADYYYLPNVPYVMFFSNSEVSPGRGFSLHGAYWHDNFGHAMSHGCVNMRTIDAKKLYEWADPPVAENKLSSSAGETGTIITIYGETP